MSLKLEVGKRYVRRDGLVTAPMEHDANVISGSDNWWDAAGGEWYFPCGTYHKGITSSKDLVEEYVDTLPPSTSPRPATRTLPTDSDARKEIPLFRGCLEYFPAALAGVARWSKIGNDKHNHGQEMYHDRGKSSDHADCILRHLMDLADLVKSGESAAALLDEVNALAWRALALSQEMHERYAGAPLAPGART